MSDCPHSAADAIVVVDQDHEADPVVGARFCRFDDCRCWIIETGDRRLEGIGLSDYRDAVAGLARERPDWRSAPIFWDLAGRAAEAAA